MRKPIPGFEGLYEATDDGRIWSTRKGGRWLKSHVNRDGHLELSLYKGGTQYTFRVHNLVALTFLGPRPEGLLVRHLNGKGADNRATNLKYGTHSENVQDCLRHGTHSEASKTHCVNDHEFTPENTYYRPDSEGRHRQCRACKRERGRVR